VKLIGTPLTIAAGQTKKCFGRHHIIVVGGIANYMQLQEGISARTNLEQFPEKDETIPTRFSA